MTSDTTALQQIILYLSAGGGAAVVAYWLLENIPQLVALAPKAKRIVSLALAATIAMLAYGAAVGLSYTEAPVNVQALIEALFAIAFLAVGGGQALHGLRKLPAG